MLNWMTDEQLREAERDAYRIAQSCAVYTGAEVAKATASGGRSARAADEWMQYRAEMQRRGIE